MNIRPLEPIDHDAWRGLWRSYLEFYRTEVPEAVYQTTWQRLLDPSEPITGALATTDDGAVGLVHLIQHRTCWALENSLYLQDLFVSPAVRGQGVGRALIEYAYARAAAMGCARVWWLTHESNETAMRLYDHVAERSGFVQYRHTVA